MPQFHTVIPIHNVRLDSGETRAFSGGLVLSPLPAWVLGQTRLNDLSANDREAVRRATHAFVFCYQAEGPNSVDPDWKDTAPKLLQDTKYEIAVLADLALWLSRPSPVCFTVVLHAPQFDSQPTIQQTERYSELLCHPCDDKVSITAADLPLAEKLHQALLELTCNTAMWTAVRAAWAGLQMNIETIRCLLFWVALEALFGPDDGREITYRLSHRVGFFLGANRDEARELFATAKAGYNFRSKILSERSSRRGSCRSHHSRSRGHHQPGCRAIYLRAAGCQALGWLAGARPATAHRGRSPLMRRARPVW